MGAKTSSLAIFGGTPVRGPEKTWPEWPMFDDLERNALLEVLESRHWWYGARVSAFEGQFAGFQDSKHCVSCTSGTTAAEICIQALGIGQGDEVIIPPYTFVATATSVMRLGAKPVFVDVDDSWTMNPELIEAAITPRTKAIMPVHFGGRVADMDRIIAIAQEHGLKVIEDACHSWGSKWRGKGTGALGHCGVFSFQESKNMTAGEGGAILTDDAEFSNLCKSIVNCGRLEGGEWHRHYHIGTNARLTEFSAALLSVQLNRLKEHNHIRARNAAVLDSALGHIEGLSVQSGDARMTSRAYHIYCLRIDADRFGCPRDRFVAAVTAEGLPVSSGYPQPLYTQPILQGAAEVNYCPFAEDLCYRSAVLFGHTKLLGTEDDMQDIIEIFTKVKEHAREIREGDPA